MAADCDVTLAQRVASLEAKLSALEQTVRDNVDNQKREGDRIAGDLRDRFASVNEFRSALNDQTSNLLTRTEYFTAHKSLETETANLRVQFAALVGERAGTKSMVALILAGVAALTAVSHAIFPAIRP